ncbi:hypothetical protein [Brevundimonas sp. Root1279]|uniref:hypothetical protein n=1 Tax=Brevundimonas sp. Root1279 TaxID=1736443 RepID=UPI0006FEFBF6|nr:hypothetical protein [Brevundimonas sp. Root1279]KQW79657.1 hypothetical protein ASC65_13970 [Brevundimonas sp. Root1279]
MRNVLLAAASAACLATPAFAQRAPDPVPIEEWPLEKVSAIGEAIYDQDVAAWVSTDALMAHLAGAQPPADMAGWIVVKDGADQRVRYLRDDAGVLKAAFDVVVRNGRAGPVKVVDEALSESEQAQFRARQTAIQNIGPLRCSRQLNAVVLDDPDSDGWLVWLLTPTPDSGAIPIGGHYRFRISADGGSVLRRDQLSNGCFFADRPPAEMRDALLFYTQIVSKGPVETHVFLSLQNRLPLVIGAGDRFFSVEGDRIEDVTDMVQK